MKDIISNTFYTNLQRIRDLSQLHLALQSFPSQNSILYSEDVLRAGVVLMHATMEDLLRGIYRWMIPNRGQEQWNKIPLKGISDRNQPKNFLLGNLLSFKGLLVEEVVKESIEEYLNYTNYNRTEDIVGLLNDVGISKETFQQFFPLLDEMMKRRHNIVHRADRVVSLESIDHTLQQISYTQVISYLENLEKFGVEMFRIV